MAKNARPWLRWPLLGWFPHCGWLPGGKLKGLRLGGLWAASLRCAGYSLRVFSVSVQGGEPITEGYRMRLRNGRFATALLGAVAVTVLAGQVVVVPAVAAPTSTPTTVKSAKERVKDLEVQASQIGEDYDAVSDALDKGKARLSTLRSDIAIQQKRVDQLNASAQSIALAQFRGRDSSTTMQIFTSGDPDTTLDRLSTASKVNDTMNKTLSEQAIEQANLTDMQRTAEAEVAALAEKEKKLSQLKANVEAKVSEADALVASLSPKDRQELDSSEGSSESADPGDYADSNAKIKKAIAYALSKVSSGQYVWGASGPNSFDCSGLMVASYRQAGISLPHSSSSQASVGRAVSKANLKPGDLIFFYSPIHHVGMYIGNGKFVHARNPRNDLMVQSLAGYGNYTSARRVVS
jgi:peptidoglycan DL-endopeptidase CwlO